MTLRDLVNRYPKGLDWEIVIPEDSLCLKCKPIKETIFGISNSDFKIYLIS